MNTEQTRFRMLPQGWAEMTAARAGEKYRPSNGTEGAIFMTGWCAKCQRDRSMREGEPVEECDDDEVCEIVAATFRHDVEDDEYPVEWQYAKDGQPCCTAFVEAGKQVPPARCPHTVDMFEHLPEKRCCDECGHTGTDGGSTNESYCDACGETVPYPNEDLCPSCGATNCMMLACPECGGRYSLGDVIE